MEGTFKRGHLHGKGSYTYSDGSKFEGNWKFDKPVGRGKLTQEDGQQVEGLFWIGKLIWKTNSKVNQVDGS